MRPAAALPLLLVLSVGCSGPPANAPIPEGMPQAPAATAEHAWLRQLIGTWDVASETAGAADSGVPEMQARFVEEVEALGDYWIVSQLSADFGGVPFRSRMTVGWDPAQGRFVATWVDTLSTYMWVYGGELDAARNALTLEAQGPSFTDPSVMTRFRDVTEFDGPDRRRNSSWMLGPDGEWSPMARATATRRR